MLRELTRALVLLSLGWSRGGSAQAAELDALDEHAVDRHLQSLIDKAGRVVQRDKASGMTGTTVNLTKGSLND
jgi:hypothetical protein